MSRHALFPFSGAEARATNSCLLGCVRFSLCSSTETVAHQRERERLLRGVKELLQNESWRCPHASSQQERAAKKFHILFNTELYVNRSQSRPHNSPPHFKASLPVSPALRFSSSTLLISSFSSVSALISFSLLPGSILIILFFSFICYSLTLNECIHLSPHCPFSSSYLIPTGTDNSNGPSIISSPVT